MKLTTLPPNIIKVSKYMYRDSKTGKRIHKSQLEKYVPIDEALKHELIINKRYDLRQD